MLSNSSITSTWTELHTSTVHIHSASKRCTDYTWVFSTHWATFSTDIKKVRHEIGQMAVKVKIAVPLIRTLERGYIIIIPITNWTTCFWLYDMGEGAVEESFLGATCFLSLIARSITKATNVIDTDDTAHFKLLIGFKLLTVICVHKQTRSIKNKNYHELRLVNYMFSKVKLYNFTPPSCCFTYQMRVLFHLSLRIRYVYNIEGWEHYLVD
jgi:hypothetical protein